MQSRDEAIPDDIEAVRAALAAERAMSKAAVSRAEAAEAEVAAAKAGQFRRPGADRAPEIVH